MGKPLFSSASPHPHNNATTLLNFDAIESVDDGQGYVNTVFKRSVCVPQNDIRIMAAIVEEINLQVGWG